MKNFVVFGSGSWGTAIACLVARSMGKVNLYSIDNKIVDEINNNHQNSTYLGNINLPKTITATSDINIIKTADVIILAIPSYAFTSVLNQLKNIQINKDTVLLVATKGLCKNPYQLFSEKLESEIENKYAFLSGPNLAKEVAEDKFASVTISSKDLTLAEKLALNFSSSKLRTTISSDLITIQIASIVKNIAAIKSGIMNAQGAGENEKASLISSALQEISTISKALGSNLASIASPAVVGDLVLTCYSKISRNTKFGYEYHRNNYSKTFLENYPILVEGIESSRLLKSFLKEKNLHLDLPIISSVFDIL